jgi:hypothetical protein
MAHDGKASCIPGARGAAEGWGYEFGERREQRLKSPTKRPFDMWLERQLHTMLEIRSEPGPP